MGNTCTGESTTSWRMIKMLSKKDLEDSGSLSAVQMMIAVEMSETMRVDLEQAKRFVDKHKGSYGRMTFATDLPGVGMEGLEEFFLNIQTRTGFVVSVWMIEFAQEMLRYERLKVSHIVTIIEESVSLRLPFNGPTEQGVEQQ